MFPNIRVLREKMTFFISSAVNQAAQHLDKIDFAYNLAQTATIWKSNRDGTFFERFDKYRTIFDRVDVLSLLCTGASLAVEIEKKYHIFQAISAVKEPITFKDLALLFTPLGACGVLLGSSYLAVHLINKCSQPKLTPRQEISTKTKVVSDVEMRWKRPPKEENKQFLLVTRGIVNIALFCFTQNPFFLLSALAEAYSLIKLCERKWVEMKKRAPFRVLDYFGLNTADNISLTSFSLLLSAEKTEEECSICFEPNTDTIFCSQHAFCSACILSYMENNAQKLEQGVTASRRTLVRKGANTYAQYEVNIPKDNICRCPVCQQQPKYNELAVRVRDVWYGWAFAKSVFV